MREHQDAAVPLVDLDAGVSFFSRRKMQDDADMDITPMIDITFLLLIFFLVASRTPSEKLVQLPQARYGTAVTTKNSVIFTIARGEHEQAILYKGVGKIASNIVSSSNLLDHEREIVAYIEAGLRGTPAKQHVLIKAERGVIHREVARVAAAAGLAGGGRELYVAVLEVR